jgi:protein-S-isoprenylcysteine O-methyltransferase Ste14
MPLRETLRAQGEWLFKQRSWLPLLLAPIVVLGFVQFSYLEGSRAADRWWSLACALVCLAGLAIRAVTTASTPKHTSGRNTKGQVADELNTTGLYSIVRNPLYVGNFLAGLGVVLFLHIWWVAAAYTVFFWGYYERIVFAEEEFLREKFGEAYIAYARATPAFFPRFRSWRPAALPFSFRTVLKREYQTVFGAVVIFCCFGVAADSVVARAFVLDVLWIAVCGANLLAYAVLRFLRKKTRVLHVEGR